MKDKNIEFTFNDFKDYVEELADIKAIYDDLINNGEIQEMLKVRQENKHLDEVNCRLRKANEQLKDNWGELKKYIQNEYKRLHGILETPSEFEMMMLLKVVDKMQELEQGSGSNE